MQKSSRLLVRNTALYTLAAIIPKLAGVVLLPVYASKMSPAEFGIAGAMGSLTLLFEVTLTLSISRGVYRLFWAQQTEQGRREYLGSVAAFVVGFGGLMTLLMVTVAAPLLTLIFPSIPFHPYYSLAIASAYLTMMAQQPQVVARLKQRAELCVLAGIADLVVRTLLIVYFVVVRGMGAYGMVLALCLAGVVQAPVYAFFNIRAMLHGVSRRMVRESLAFCIPMIPSLLALSLAETLNRSFLDRYAGLAAIGLFTIASRLAAVSMLVTGALQQAYQPLFFELAAKSDQTSVRPQIHKGHALYLFGSVSCLAAVALLLPDYVALFFNARYSGAQAILPLMTLTYLFAVPSKLLNFSIYMRKKSYLVTLYDIQTAVLNVALNFVLVPRFGLVGACSATAMAFAIPIALKYRLSNRCYELAFPWGPVVVSYGLTALAFVVSSFVSVYANIQSMPWRVALVLLLIWLYGLSFLRATGTRFSQVGFRGLLAMLRNPKQALKT